MCCIAACTKSAGPTSNPVQFQQIESAGHSYEIAAVDLHQANLRLFWKKPDGSRFADFEALQTFLSSSNQRLVFATNAGIFDQTFAPCGLHVEAGAELSPLNLKDGVGNFYLKPNGVFYIDAAGAKIVDATKYEAQFQPGATQPGENATSPIQLATQSGPLLLIDGSINPLFATDSSNRRIRSGVGVADDGRVIFAISKDPVTFYEFASLFQIEKCAQALYLDGEISQFFGAADVTPAHKGNFAGILAVTTKN